jgi:hypothetical protein
MQVEGLCQSIKHRPVILVFDGKWFGCTDTGSRLQDSPFEQRVGYRLKVCITGYYSSVSDQFGQYGVDGPAPEEFPNMVILSGSPPNAEIYLLIHCKATR